MRALLGISTIAYQIIYSILLPIFGYITSSIERECAVLMPRSDKEDICSRRIWLWLWISSRTCPITANKLLPSAAKMVEIFCLSQKRDLCVVVAVSVSEVVFKSLCPKIMLPFLNASRLMKMMHESKTSSGDMKGIKCSNGKIREMVASVGSVRVLVMVVGLMFCGVGFHATSKGV